MVMASDIFTPPDLPDVPGTRPRDEGTWGIHCYWRKPDGTIFVNGRGPAETDQQLKLGRVPLQQYGTFMRRDQARGINIQVDKFMLLLQQGGIREFGLEQIMEMGWHRHPHWVLQEKINNLIATGIEARDALDIVIPQLKGVTWQTFTCEWCPKEEFDTDVLLKHHEIIHQEDAAARRQGQQIANALAEAQKGNAAAFLPIVQALVDGQQSMQQALAQNQALMEALVARVATIAPEETPQVKK